MSGASVSNSFQVAMGFVLLEGTHLRHLFALRQGRILRGFASSIKPRVRRNGRDSDTLTTRETSVHTICCGFEFASPLRIASFRQKMFFGRKRASSDFAELCILTVIHTAGIARKILHPQAEKFIPLELSPRPGRKHVS